MVSCIVLVLAIRDVESQDAFTLCGGTKITQKGHSTLRLGSLWTLSELEGYIPSALDRII